MSKTFSDEQIKVIKHLIDLQMEVDTRFRNKIQENFLRYDMNNEELKKQLISLRDSIDYVLDEKFSYLFRTMEQ